MSSRTDEAAHEFSIDAPVDYRSAILASSSSIVITDATRPGNPIVFVNPAFETLTGYSRREASGRNCLFLQGPDTDKHALLAIRTAISRGLPLRREILSYRRDGTSFWADITINPTYDRSGRVKGFVGIILNVTEQRAASTVSAEAEARLSSIVDNMPGYVFQRSRQANGDVDYPYFSPSFGRLIGYPEGTTVTAADLWKHIHPDDVEAVRGEIAQADRSIVPRVIEYRLITNGGEQRWIRVYSSPERLANGRVIWDGVAVDVTAEKDTQLRLAYVSQHDPLTGLANRSLLTERLTAAISLVRKETQTQVAVSHLLLVGFSEITETLGAYESDEVLKSVAARLDGLSALDQSCTAALIGTAEFAIIRSGLPADAHAFAQSLIRSLSQPILVGREALIIEPCMGTAELKASELQEQTPENVGKELLKRAAIALSAANKAGPGSHRVYDEALDHRTRHRMMLRHSLRLAVEENQFELHYQPLVDLRSGAIVSAEALIRWQHPELGLLRPDLFIPLAEESGLIGLLGEWVMRAALRQMKAWDILGLTMPRIALNISGIQVKMPEFLPSVRRILAETEIDARRIELELTEGVLLDASAETMATLDDLKSQGFALVIDDFGAGHASFHYLRSFPIDKIKVDQMFVRQLVVDSTDALIVRAIASLAQSLGIGLVAEGIETAQQHAFLRDQGYATGQGYFFSMPLKAEDFAWMIEHDVILPLAPKTKQ